MTHILFLGCGKIGHDCIGHFKTFGYKVTGVRRSHIVSEDCAVNWLSLDLLEPDAFKQLPDDVSVIIYTPSPSRGVSDSYRRQYLNVIRLLALKYRSSSCLQRVILVSSTRVYGERSGDWVDESTIVTPQDEASTQIYAAEQLLLTAFPGKASVLRLSGIYGSSRTWQLKKVLLGQPYRQSPPYYTNRIHQDDVVGLLIKMVLADTIMPIVIGVDAEPVSEAEVVGFLVKKMDLPPLKPLAKPVMLQNKRCLNLGIQSLGYQYLYPTFREGYSAILSVANKGQKNVFLD